MSLVALCATAQQSARPPVSPQNSSDPATVQGVVLSRSTSAPVAHASLRLTNEDGRFDHRYESASDANGNFSFTDVKPGSYRLTAEHSSYLPFYGNRAANSIALTIGAARAVEGVRVRMELAGVIKGRVQDREGEPVARAVVAVIQEAYVRGRRRPKTVGSALTDDHGDYRIHSLLPGHYYLVASRPHSNEDLRTASLQPGRSVYVATYYPGTSDSGEAIAVDLRGGEEMPLTITLAQAETVPVGGEVIVSGGVARTGVVEFSSVIAGQVLPAASAAITGSGHFETRLVPGTYRAVATAGSDTARRIVRIPRAGIPNLVIQTAASSQVTARANVLFSPKSGYYGSETATLTLVPTADADEDVESVAGAVTGNFDRRYQTYEFKDVPAGRYEVVTTIPRDMSANSYVQSVSGGRGDVSGVVELNGQNRVSLSVTIRLDGSEITGIAFGSNNQPMPETTIVAVPDAPLRGRTNLYKVVTSDQDGKFTIHGLPPGRYTLFAFADVEDGMWLNPAFLHSIEGRGENVTVDDNDRKRVNVAVIESIAAP